MGIRIAVMDGLSLGQDCDGECLCIGDLHPSASGTRMDLPIWRWDVSDSKYPTELGLLLNDAKFGLLALHLIEIDGYKPETKVIIGCKRHIRMVKITGNPLIEYRSMGERIFKRRIRS